MCYVSKFLRGDIYIFYVYSFIFGGCDVFERFFIVVLLLFLLDGGNDFWMVILWYGCVVVV